MSKALLVGFLTKAYNKTEDEINALIFNGDEVKDTALQSLIDLDALKVSKFKNEQTKMFDNGYKKAQKEVLTDYEKKVKESLSFESDLAGDDFIESLKSEFEKSKASAGKSKLTDDDVKKHPVFIDFEKRAKKEKEEAIAAKENEFTHFKTGIERTNKLSIVKTKAVDVFTSLNPILSKVPAIAENQKKMFLREFDNFGYEIAEDGDIVILNEKGERLENKNSYPITFPEFVKTKAESLFEFAVQDAKGGTGNKKDDKKQQQKTGIVNMFPKSEIEFGESLLALGNDDAKIVELSGNWNTYNKK